MTARTALLVVVVLLGVACAGVDGGQPQGPAPPAPAEQGEQAEQPEQPEQDAEGEPGPPTSAPDRAGGEGDDAQQPGAPADEPTAAAPVVDDDGAVGAAGAVLLSPSVPAAVVEVDRSDGADLGVDASRVVAEQLSEHGGKSSVETAGGSRVPAQDVYSADDLRALTAEHRDQRSSSDRVAVYVLVLEGRYENERVTGVAFGATTFAVFPDQIGGVPLGVNAAAYETAVIVHELGHLFGLVNLTGEGKFHEDPEHPGHSRNERSVMYWAVEDISIADVFAGGPPREFDADDRREMDRIRGS